MLPPGHAHPDGARRTGGGGIAGRRSDPDDTGREYGADHLGRPARGGLRQPSAAPKGLAGTRGGRGVRAGSAAQRSLAVADSRGVCRWRADPSAVHLINGCTIMQVPAERVMYATTLSCRSMAWCWPRECQRRVSLICGMGPTTRTVRVRSGCIRTSRRGCGRRSGAQGWSSPGRSWTRRGRWSHALRYIRPPPDRDFFNAIGHL